MSHDENDFPSRRNPAPLRDFTGPILALKIDLSKAIGGWVSLDAIVEGIPQRFSDLKSAGVWLERV